MEEKHSFQNLPNVESLSGKGNGSAQVTGEDIEDYFKRVGRNLSKELRSESRSFAVEQLHSLSGKLEDVAGVLIETAKQLREKRSNSIADLVEAGSDGLTRVSRDLLRENAERIVDRVESFVRNQPVIFLGAVAAAAAVIWQLSSSADRKTDDGEMTSIEYPPGEEERYGRH